MKEVLDKKYRDCLNIKNHFKPCGDDQDTESHDKEKVAAMFEKSVHCTEPADILDRDGETCIPLLLFSYQSGAQPAVKHSVVKTTRARNG